MRIGIVGTGISGLLAARLLARRNEVTVFESAPRLGGHTNTVSVPGARGPLGVDTGFIVFNETNYPILTRLFEKLGVASRPTEMSFSVKSAPYDTEFAGTSLATLYADRRNLLRPWFHGMLFDLLRFQRVGLRDLERLPPTETLGSWIAERGFGAPLVDNYVVPLGASLWSAPREQLMAFPARFYLDFLANHRMLSLGKRPLWRTVVGGSSRYLDPLTAPFRERIRTGDAVARVRREGGRLEVTTQSGHAEAFDHLVLACHADTSLELLEEPTDVERELLGAFPFRTNDVVLHTDTELLPRRRSLWSSWNYVVVEDADRPALVTYDMNVLMGLEEPETYCVTLNGTERIAPGKILRRLRYAHPQATAAGARARARREELVAHAGISYCGAWLGFGFHEDGARSAVEVARHFGEELE